MSQVSAKLRRGEDRYFHWCSACGELHPLPDTWKFDGNIKSPTFSPSFKHTGMRRVLVDGKWTGKWVLDAEGKPVKHICHYILTAGVLNFCGDCTHELAGKSIPLPDLPTCYRDKSFRN